MVSMWVDRVAAIGKVRPDLVGHELVLRYLGPQRVLDGVAVMAAVYFLQKHDVRLHGAHRVAQLRQDESPVQCGEALVGVHRENSETEIGRSHGGGSIVGATLIGQSVCLASWPYCGHHRERL